MNCKKTRLCFYDHTDDALDPATRLAIESHLSNCAACRRHYETQRRLHQSVSNAVAGELADLHFHPKPITAEPSSSDHRSWLGLGIRQTAFALPAFLLLGIILWPLLKPAPELLDDPDQSVYAEAYHYLEMYSVDKPGASRLTTPLAVIVQPGVPARVVELDGTTDLSTELK
jgi:anti-sigma factor RsiW